MTHLLTHLLAFLLTYPPYLYRKKQAEENKLKEIEAREAREAQLKAEEDQRKKYAAKGTLPRMYTCICLLMHLLTYSLTHLLTYSLTHSLRNGNKSY